MSPTSAFRIHPVDGVLRDLVRVIEDARHELQEVARAAPQAEVSEGVANWLYAHWYSAGSSAAVDAQPCAARDDLVPALRAALASSGRWESGWVALKVMSDGGCIASRGRTMRELAPGEYANVARPGVPAAPGDGLAVLDRLAWVDAPTGFWGARTLAAEPAHPQRRVYLSVAWHQVGAVLAQLVPTLDASGRAWSLKCPSRALGFARVDALVVYVAKDDWQIFEPLLRGLAARIAASMRSSVPPLTLAIGRGMSVADSPGQLHSFGQSRCLALAEGVLTLIARRHLKPSSAVEVLKRSLSSHGVDPSRPWEGN